MVIFEPKHQRCVVRVRGYFAALRLRIISPFQGRCPWLNYSRTFGAAKDTVVMHVSD